MPGSFLEWMLRNEVLRVECHRHSIGMFGIRALGQDGARAEIEVLDVADVDAVERSLEHALEIARNATTA